MVGDLEARVNGSRVAVEATGRDIIVRPSLRALGGLVRTGRVVSGMSRGLGLRVRVKFLGMTLATRTL